MLVCCGQSGMIYMLHNITPLFSEHVYEFSPRIWAHIIKLNLYSVRWIPVGKSVIRVEVVYFVNVFSSSRQISGQYVILVKTTSFLIPSKSSLTNLQFYIAWATNSLGKWTIRYSYLSDKYLQKNRYMGAVNNTTIISNDVYRGWKYNYMFRPNPAIIRFTSKDYQRFVTTMWLCKDGEISSSGFNYVIIKNLVGEWGVQ